MLTADCEPHPDPGDGAHRGQCGVPSHQEVRLEVHVSVIRAAFTTIQMLIPLLWMLVSVC